MREAKFRAWDKKRSIMINVITIDFAERKIFGKYNIYTRFEEIELLEYTGLLDKNGVEIYEGDIIEYVGNSCPCCHSLADVMENYRCEIRWDSEYAHFEAYCHKYDDTLCADDWVSKCEVIGNIYTDPQLIK